MNLEAFKQVSLDDITTTLLNGSDLDFDNCTLPEVIGFLQKMARPLKGRSYTWSNMQVDPLLEQLDWFLTSSSWISIYPNIVVFPMAKTGSDHVPCIVSIDTTIPKSNIFRFENFWVELPGFRECVTASWAALVSSSS